MSVLRTEGKEKADSVAKVGLPAASPFYVPEPAAKKDGGSGFSWRRFVVHHLNSRQPIEGEANAFAAEKFRGYSSAIDESAVQR